VGTSCAVRIYGQTSLKTSKKIPTRRRGLLPNRFGDFGGEKERTWSIDHMAPKLWVNCISSPNTDKINILQNRRRICSPSAAV
jgi:hypothetical protein